MTSHVTLVGNLTRDPDLRYLATGRAICNFGIAVNRRWKGADDEWQEQTSFYNVSAWTTLGENVAASLQKGARVVVFGRLEQRSWETDEGEKRSVVEIIADEIGPSLRWAQCSVTRTERVKAPKENEDAPPPREPEEPF